MTFNSNNEIQFEELFNSRIKSKIIKLLALNSEMIISKIRIQCNANPISFKKHISYLSSINLINMKKFGKITICEYNKENKLANLIKKMIIDMNK